MKRSLVVAVRVVRQVLVDLQEVHRVLVVVKVVVEE